MDSSFGGIYTDMQQLGSPNVDTKLVGKIAEVLSNRTSRFPPVVLSF